MGSAFSCYSKGGALVDPLTLKPHRLHLIHTETPDDKQPVRINALVCTKGNKLLLMDDTNNKLKMVDLQRPKPSVDCCRMLDFPPFSAAELFDGVVAVTTVSRMIYLVDIVGEDIQIKSKLQTVREYRGVTALREHHLLVSCRNDRHGPARVDMIDRAQGRLVRTVVDDVHASLPSLFCPYHISLDNAKVIVSGFATHSIYKLSMSTGALVETHMHAKLQFPQQLTVDASSNVYVASAYGHCVLALSSTGEWCRLLESEKHSEKGYDKPHGVGLIHDRIVVAWNRSQKPFDSIVISYQLKGIDSAYDS